MKAARRWSKLTGARAIRILIPAFSLAEPHIALMHKGNERSRFIPELRKHLSELARSKSYQKDSPAFTEIVSLVIASEDRERAQLAAAVDALLSVAEIIPLTSEIFQEAKGFQAKFDMSFQDSVVLFVRRRAPAGCRAGRKLFPQPQYERFRRPQYSRSPGSVRLQIFWPIR